jgi:hypothetical protein
MLAALEPAPISAIGDLIVWVPSEAAKVKHYLRFLGKRVFKCNVRNPHDERRVLAFLAELREEDFDAVSPERPLALRESAVARELGFEVRAIVHPRIARSALSEETLFLLPVTYQTFPAHVCEFAADATPDEARYRLAKIIPWSAWDRERAPAVSVRVRSGEKEMEGKALGMASLPQAEQVLAYVGEHDGLLEIENFRRERVIFRHADGKYRLEALGEARVIERELVPGFLRRFLEGSERGRPPRGLEPVVRAYYGDVRGREHGELKGSELEQLGTLLAAVANALPVAAVWSAARAVIFPQLEPALWATAKSAIDEVLAGLRANGAVRAEDVPSLRVLEALDPRSIEDAMASRRASAARSVAAALRCAIAPSPAAFAATILHLADAQRDPAYPEGRARWRWLGWLDDVITRSDRFALGEILELLAEAVAGSLPKLPHRFIWEAAGLEDGSFDVWTVDPTTRRSVKSMLGFAEPKLVADVLSVVVKTGPGCAVDQLRVEYFFEHEVNRLLTDSFYTDRYRCIEFELDDGTRRWVTPA